MRYTLRYDQNIYLAFLDMLGTCWTGQVPTPPTEFIDDLPVFILVGRR